jgi:hypothetical protein
MRLIPKPKRRLMKPIELAGKWLDFSTDGMSLVCGFDEDYVMTSHDSFEIESLDLHDHGCQGWRDTPTSELHTSFEVDEWAGVNDAMKKWKSQTQMWSQYLSARINAVTLSMRSITESVYTRTTLILLNLASRLSNQLGKMPSWELRKLRPGWESWRPKGDSNFIKRSS